MSAEEFIYYTYGGVNSDDFSDWQDVSGDCTLEAGGDTYNYPIHKRHTIKSESYLEAITQIKSEQSTQQEEAPVMANSFLVNRNVVEVRFDERGALSEKSYAYFTDIKLAVNDWVVVVVGQTPKTALVTKVSGVSQSSKSKACKWIASKVDLTEYELKVKQDEVLREIEDTIDAELKRISRLELLKNCAKSSPVMQNLLEQLNQLNPSLNLLEDISTKEASNET